MAAKKLIHCEVTTLFEGSKVTEPKKQVISPNRTMEGADLNDKVWVDNINRGTRFRSFAELARAISNPAVRYCSVVASDVQGALITFTRFGVQEFANSTPDYQGKAWWETHR